MVSASVWRLLTVVVFWLLVALRAARSSLYLMKYTVRSKPSTLFLQNNSYKSSSQELLFFCPFRVCQNNLLLLPLQNQKLALSF